MAEVSLRLGSKSWEAPTPRNCWCVTNLPSEADKLWGFTFCSRRKEQISDEGSEILFGDKAGFAVLISFPQDIKIEEKEASLIRFHFSRSMWLCRSFFTLSIVFLPNSLYLILDLVLLFYDGLGEHCRELGFWGGACWQC